MGIVARARGSRKQLICAFLCAGALYAGAEPPREPMPTAYHDGATVTVNIKKPARGHRSLYFGPWQFGIFPRGGERPRDGRLNLYVVVPGKQHHAEGWDDYDHTMIVNAVPHSDEGVEWDMYWVLVLDPHMRDDLRSERDLLLLAQDRFLPGDLFEFDDIPAEVALRDYLHVSSVEGLRPYRHSDGTLPRILVVPAGCVVRMKIEEPDAPAD